MNFEETEKKVIQWATERLFFSENGSSAKRQYAKLDEELAELGKALLNNDLPNVIDGLGDMMVVMSIIAEYHHTNLSYCFDSAYNVIKDRRGKMVDGLFVKEQ